MRVAAKSLSVWVVLLATLALARPSAAWVVAAADPGFELLPDGSVVLPDWGGDRSFRIWTNGSLLDELAIGGERWMLRDGRPVRPVIRRNLRRLGSPRPGLDREPIQVAGSGGTMELLSPAGDTLLEIDLSGLQPDLSADQRWAYLAETKRCRPIARVDLASGERQSLSIETMKAPCVGVWIAGFDGTLLWRQDDHRLAFFEVADDGAVRLLRRQDEEEEIDGVWPLEWGGYLGLVRDLDDDSTELVVWRADGTTSSRDARDSDDGIDLARDEVSPDGRSRVRLEDDVLEVTNLSSGWTERVPVHRPRAGEDWSSAQDRARRVLDAVAAATSADELLDLLAANPDLERPIERRLGELPPGELLDALAPRVAADPLMAQRARAFLRRSPGAAGPVWGRLALAGRVPDGILFVLAATGGAPSPELRSEGLDRYRNADLDGIVLFMAGGGEPDAGMVAAVLERLTARDERWEQAVPADEGDDVFAADDALDETLDEIAHVLCTRPDLVWPLVKPYVASSSSRWHDAAIELLEEFEEPDAETPEAKQRRDEIERTIYSVDSVD